MSGVTVDAVDGLIEELVDGKEGDTLATAPGTGTVLGITDGLDVGLSVGVGTVGC